MLQPYLEKIRRAPVYDVAVESPLELAKGLSKRLNNAVLLKREDLQQVFSFKLRGAYTKMVSLSEAQRANGAIAASAGNHAQGVALSARKAERKLKLPVARRYRNTTIADVNNDLLELNENNNRRADAYTVAASKICEDGDERYLKCLVGGRPGFRRDICVRGIWILGRCRPGEIP